MSVGNSEAKFKVGDRVAVGMFSWACGECKHCFRGRNDLCQKAQYTGGYGTYLDVCSDWGIAVPRNVHDESVPAIISDGSIVYSAFSRHIHDKCAKVGILGSKAIGRLAYSFSKALGFETDVIGEVEDKEDIEKLGAKFFDVTTKEVKFDHAYNVVLLCSQKLDSVWYANAMKWTKLGGKVIIVGHPIQ